ncbi:hypothetical protein [Rhizobium tropici]|nr:hypothetical protein [Rhizobium tropici]
MASHDNRDNILSDQQLHDLLKAEDEKDHPEKAKLGKPDDLVVPAEE